MKKYKLVIFLILLITAAQNFAGDLKGKIKSGSRGLNYVVVYLEPVKKITFSPPSEPAVMDQVNLSFVPHILPVLVGTKMIFPNSDRIRHSVFSLNKTKKFDFGTYPPGTEKSIICDQPGVISILCYIHHDMSAYIVVLETPYFSLTNEEGEFSISDVPSGNYKLSFWHEDEQIKSEEIFIPDKGIVNKNFNVNE
ncbi:MAG: hypothetical protein Q7S39_00110 [Ignavibacteria bacterium]|nr:hypothetical protein [Ignavibacteria bacterium]